MVDPKDAKKVFEFLKKDGECWHEWKHKDNHPFTAVLHCKHCDKAVEGIHTFATGEERFHIKYAGNRNPDFLTPDGAEWIMERLKLPLNVMFCKVDDVFACYLTLTSGTFYRGEAKTFPLALFNAVRQMAEEAK